MKPECPLRLKKGCDDAIRTGMPWAYAGDIIPSSELMMLPAGSLVSIETHKGQFLGIGYYNASSTIACRVLTLENTPINTTFFEHKLASALSLRQKLVDVPYYRLVHSEADGLPGLLIDRFDDILSIQVGTAGMEQLMPLWMESLHKLLAPKAIILRNDFASRSKEGLQRSVTIAHGQVPELVEVQENGCIYFADLLKGQKTGWFYDQRDNRRMIADIANGKTVADIYSHSGGFGILAALRGASHTLLVDSSELALSLAQKAASRNGANITTQRGDAIAVMQELHKEGKCFDIVCADPPAFVKSKKDITTGMKGYAKVALNAAKLAKPGGMLFIASCSHHAGRSRFNQTVMEAVNQLGITPRIIKQTGAAPDHPMHPRLPQNEYLKGLLLQL